MKKKKFAPKNKKLRDWLVKGGRESNGIVAQIVC